MPASAILAGCLARPASISSRPRSSFTSCSASRGLFTTLNARRIFTRDGGRWGIGQVHRILTRPTYIGRHEFNKRGKTKELKPASEVIPVEVPPLIDQATFDAVQAHLRSRNPRVTPARVVSGPTLLTGICFCADCGGAMTLRIGKGGRYRYYTCSIKARQGETGGGGYRRDHIRALAQRVEVAEGEVRIMGSKGDLRTLAAASGVKSAAGGVCSSVLKWRIG